jgi:hypothetical protein
MRACILFNIVLVLCNAFILSFIMFIHMHRHISFRYARCTTWMARCGAEPEDGVGGSIPKMEEPSSAYMEWRCSARRCKLT